MTVSLERIFFKTADRCNAALSKLNILKDSPSKQLGVALILTEAFSDPNPANILRNRLVSFWEKKYFLAQEVNEIVAIIRQHFPIFDDIKKRRDNDGRCSEEELESEYGRSAEKSRSSSESEIEDSMQIEKSRTPEEEGNSGSVPEIEDRMQVEKSRSPDEEEAIMFDGLLKDIREAMESIPTGANISKLQKHAKQLVFEIFPSALDIMMCQHEEKESMPVLEKSSQGQGVCQSVGERVSTSPIGRAMLAIMIRDLSEVFLGIRNDLMVSPPRLSEVLGFFRQLSVRCLVDRQRSGSIAL